MFHMSRRRILASTAAVLLFPALPLYASGSIVSKNRSGAALDGYDTTAYWDIAAPLKGEKAYVVEWHEATWMFASQESADKFAATPDAFAPQFGGHCTRAMSFGKVVHGDPEVWRIYGDKLYLFAQPVGGEKFDEGQDEMIAKAQAHWDTLS